MIDLYYWPTPNGHKITIFLEETGTPYKLHPINIGKGEQFNPAFLAIAPNNRMPAIVDHAPVGGGAPISIFESGAILLYLAEKTGKLLATDLRGRVATLEWLFRLGHAWGDGQFDGVDGTRQVRCGNRQAEQCPDMQGHHQHQRAHAKP